MDKVNAKLGTDYKLFNYYGAPDADRVIVAMGSICDVAEEVIDYLNAHGEKVGLIKVRLYRPFVTEKFIEALPKTCTKLAVLDRTKEPGSIGEPLYLDVVTALAQAGVTGIKVSGGRYGLGSKDTPPCLRTRTAPTRPQRAPSSASSGVLAATARLAPTRTRRRSSATTPTSTSSPTSSTTPRRRAVSPSRTCALATPPSAARTTSTRPRSWSTPSTPTPSATSPRTTCSSTPSTPSIWRARWAWASAPTPSCSLPSSR